MQNLINLLLKLSKERYPYIMWPFPNQEQESTVNEEPLRFVHVIGRKGKGGVTLAYVKTSNFKNTRMVNVAAAYCSPHDTFSKKKGATLAREMFENGVYITVPARTFNSDSTIPGNLREMFWNSVA